MHRIEVAKALRGDWPPAWNELPEDQQRRWLVRADRVIQAMEKPVERKLLVDDARDFWRWWSVRLNAAGLAILTWVQFDPVGVLYVWSLMPDEIRWILPPRFLAIVGLALFALSMIARVVKQKPKNG
jgi:uncharacterized membrane-anchored protein